MHKAYQYRWTLVRVKEKNVFKCQREIYEGKKMRIRKMELKIFFFGIEKLKKGKEKNLTSKNYLLLELITIRIKPLEN